MANPFVMTQTLTFRPVSALTIRVQSGRMKTSPPIMDTRLHPSSAS